MGNAKQLTITRQVFNKDLPGYETYKLYLAREPDYGYMSRGSNVYLLTRENYRNDERVHVDYEDETVPMAGNPSGKFDGHDILVHQPRHISLSGHFRVKSMIPANDPQEHFRNQTIQRSQYMLFLAERAASHGYKSQLCHVFSKVLYLKGEEIPVSETDRLYRINNIEKTHYFVHDKSKYDSRAYKALRAMMGKN